MSIGELIRHLRNERGWKLKELREAMEERYGQGVSEKSITKIERGEVSPRFRTVDLIFGALLDVPKPEMEGCVARLIWNVM